jgi:hypothetical protein
MVHICKLLTRVDAATNQDFELARLESRQSVER